jgi:hypothetical protein
MKPLAQGRSTASEHVTTIQVIYETTRHPSMEDHPRKVTLLDYVDVLLSTHLLEQPGPDRGADLSQVRLLEQEHEGPRLTDPARSAFLSVMCIFSS